MKKWLANKLCESLLSSNFFFFFLSKIPNQTFFTGKKNPLLCVQTVWQNHYINRHNIMNNNLWHYTYSEATILRMFLYNKFYTHRTNWRWRIGIGGNFLYYHYKTNFFVRLQKQWINRKSPPILSSRDQ